MRVPAGSGEGSLLGCRLISSSHDCRGQRFLRSFFLLIPSKRGPPSGLKHLPKVLLTPFNTLPLGIMLPTCDFCGRYKHSDQSIREIEPIGCVCVYVCVCEREREKRL